MDEWIRTMRNTKPLPGTKGVMIPGDPERNAYKKRMKEGIPVNGAVVNSLQCIADETGIELKMEA